MTIKHSFRALLVGSVLGETVLGFYALADFLRAIGPDTPPFGLTMDGE